MPPTVSDALLARAQYAVAADQPIYLTRAEADELAELVEDAAVPFTAVDGAYVVDNALAAEQAAAVTPPEIPAAPLPDA